MDPPPPPPGYRPGHYQGGAAPQQQHNNNNNNEMKTGQIYNSHEQIQEYVCYYLFWLILNLKSFVLPTNVFLALEVYFKGFIHIE